MVVKSKDRILKHMKENGSINKYEAATECGEMDLPARIAELRKEGHSISKKMVKGMNRFGDIIHFAVYSLEE